MSDSQKRMGVLHVVVVVVLAAVLWGVAGSLWKKQQMPKIDPNGYQMVYLSNNQQYFGHLKNYATRHPYMTDVYYVQVLKGNSENGPNQQFNLVKMGSEIHGPEDAVYLNWDNVVYWENLRSDSKIVEGITKEKAKRLNEAAASTQPDSAPAEESAPAKKKK